MARVVSEQCSILTEKGNKEIVQAVAKRSFSLGTLPCCQGKIYKIVQLDMQEIVAYIGSTIKQLSQRWSGHKSFFIQCPNAGWTKYVLSRGGVMNFKIVLLEQYPCHTKKELLDREAFHINSLNPVCNIALRKATSEEIETRFRLRYDWRPLRLDSTTLIRTPIVDEETFRNLESLMKTENTMTEDIRWQCYKRRYMQSWGISVVDSDFIEKNGFDVSRNHVKMLISFLFPEISIQDWERPRTTNILACHNAFKEILGAMTLQHPFDVATVADAEDIKEKVLATDFFINYENNVKLFNTRAERVQEWTNKRFCQSVNTIFSSFGLAIKSKSIRSTQGMNRTRKYRYFLDEDKTVRTAALINLYNKNGYISHIQGVDSFLKKVGLDKYHKYA